MRRDIGLILAGLGTFLIVLAVAIPTVLPSRIIKFPLNYYYVATLHSPNTTYYSPCTFGEVTGANVTATYTIKGVGNLGTSSTAVWDQFSSLVDFGANCKIQLQNRQLAFDRRNAMLVDCCGNTYAGESGVAGLVWPMNTKQQSYQVYDTTLRKPVTFTYAGPDTVDGVPVYKFQENVPPTKIGFSPLSTTDPEMYGINLTYWVDPQTGALLTVSEHQQEFLVDPVTGSKTTTLFDGTLSPDAPSVQAIVNIDNSGRLKITLFTLIIPLVSGILGLILLLLGIWMYLRKQPDVVESGYDAMTRELAASVAETRPPGPRPASDGAVAAAEAPPADAGGAADAADAADAGESGGTASTGPAPSGTAPSGTAPSEQGSAQPLSAPVAAPPAAKPPGARRSGSKPAPGKHAAGSASTSANPASDAAAIVPGLDANPPDSGTPAES
jgi:Porin PorA